MINAAQLVEREPNLRGGTLDQSRLSLPPCPQGRRTRVGHPQCGGGLQFDWKGWAPRHEARQETEKRDNRFASWIHPGSAPLVLSTSGRAHSGCPLDHNEMQNQASQRRRAFVAVRTRSAKRPLQVGLSRKCEQEGVDAFQSAWYSNLRPRLSVVNEVQNRCRPLNAYEGHFAPGVSAGASNGQGEHRQERVSRFHTYCRPRHHL